MKVLSPIIANAYLRAGRNANRASYLETHGSFLSPTVLVLIERSRTSLRGVTLYVVGGWRNFVIRDGEIAPIKK